MSHNEQNHHHIVPLSTYYAIFIALLVGTALTWWVATIDLGAATTSARRLVWVGRWPTSARRTVTVRVLGTVGRPRVDLDGFVVLR